MHLAHFVIPMHSMAHPRYSARVHPALAERINAFADDWNLDDSDAVRVLFGRGSTSEQAGDQPTSHLDTKVVHGQLLAAFVVATFGLILPNLSIAAALYVVVAAVLGKAIGVTVAQVIAVALGLAALPAAALPAVAIISGASSSPLPSAEASVPLVCVLVLVLLAVLLVAGVYIWRAD